MGAWIAISTTSERSLTGRPQGHGYDSVVPLYKEQGVVLRSVKLGEADKIVTVMTQGSGKVRAVAKGIRKTTSRFGARLEPFTHVFLMVFRGRGCGCSGRTLSGRPGDRRPWVRLIGAEVSGSNRRCQVSAQVRTVVCDSLQR
jgi:hypothetical protein